MPRPGFGLLVLDEGVTASRLTAQGAGLRDSAYSQAGPEPGHTAQPPGAWRPSVVVAQDTDLEALTLRGGFGGRWAASVAVRRATELDEGDWRGWDEPTLLTNVSAPAAFFSSSATWDEFTTMCVLPDQQILLTVLDDSTLEGQTYRYDPRAESWTEVFVWHTEASGLALPLCMVHDAESDRLLLFHGAGTNTFLTPTNRNWISYYSEDGGESWNVYSRGFFDFDPPEVGGADLYIAPKIGQDWLAFVAGDLPNIGGGNGYAQFASSDRGVTWDLIEATNADTDTMVVATRTGFAVAYINPSAEPCVRLLPTARTPFSDASELVLDTGTNGTVGRILICVDEDGILYVMTRGPNVTGTRADVRLYYSLDDGAAWSRYDWDAMQGEDDGFTAAAYHRWSSFVAANGQLHAAGIHSAQTLDTAQCVLLATFGGWSNVENGSGSIGFEQSRKGRFGFGDTKGAGTSGQGKVWIPWDLPENMGWTANNAAGTTVTQVPAGEPAATRIQRAGSGFYTWTYGVPQHIFGAGHATLKLHSTGNSTLATIGTSSVGVRIRHRVSDGSNDWELQIDVGSDGVQLNDRNGNGGAGAIRASKTDFDPSAEYFHLRWNIRGASGTADGSADVWYRALGSDRWILWADAVVLNSSTGITSEISWGQGAGTDGDVYWRLLGGAVEGEWRHGLDTPADVFNDPQDARLGLQWGKSLPVAGDRYPVPLASSAASGSYGFLAASGGPAYHQQQVALPAGFVHGVDQLGAVDSPSPRQAWRSTTTSDEIVLCWDLGAPGGWRGHVIGLVVLQAWPREFFLDIDDGAGGWLELGELDKSWEALSWTRSGSVIAPNTGTNAIARYFHEGELVGGYFQYDNTSLTPRRILANAGGYWSDRAGVQRLVLELEDVDDGADPTSSTLGKLVHHSAVALFQDRNTASVGRRYVRIRIPAGQVTPTGDYRIGALGIGRVIGVGADPSWDWDRQVELTRELSRRTDAYLQIRRTGPARRVLTYAWPEGVFLRDLHDEALAPPAVVYEARSSVDGLPIGTQEDAHSTLIGAIEHRMRSGELPCVVLPRLPERGISESAAGLGNTVAPDVVTDPFLYLYGRLLSDAQGVSGLVGEEGVDDVVRVDGLTFEELR